jgi:hypothetical protein
MGAAPLNGINLIRLLQKRGSGSWRSIPVVDRRRGRRVIAGRRPVVAIRWSVVAWGVAWRAVITAVRSDRGADAETHETADYRRPGRATSAVVMITSVPTFGMNGRGYRQSRDNRRGA